MINVTYQGWILQLQKRNSSRFLFSKCMNRRSSNLYRIINKIKLSGHISTVSANLVFNIMQGFILPCEKSPLFPKSISIHNGFPLKVFTLCLKKPFLPSHKSNLRTICSLITYSLKAPLFWKKLCKACYNPSFIHQKIKSYDKPYGWIQIVGWIEQMSDKDLWRILLMKLSIYQQPVSVSGTVCTLEQYN